MIDVWAVGACGCRARGFRFPRAGARALAPSLKPCGIVGRLPRAVAWAQRAQHLAQRWTRPRRDSTTIRQAMLCSAARQANRRRWIADGVAWSSEVSARLMAPRSWFSGQSTWICRRPQLRGVGAPFCARVVWTYSGKRFHAWAP